jgi:RNA polymerase sigma-70 factor (ECF subfamily)
METATESDAQLVARCRAGEVDAWNAFVERFSRYVYAICSRGFRLGREDAEDVFQEVFARAYEKLTELRSDDAVLPWLGMLTRRLCIDRLRVLARDAPDGTEPDEHAADEQLRSIDEAIAVRAALDAVGDPCRDILDRFFCRDESYRTIGAALDLAPGTIASRISRCLAKIRDELMEGPEASARLEE